MTLYEKSQHILELPAVLKLLSSMAVSSGAKEAAEQLTPTADRAEAERRLSETTDARDMMTLLGSPSFSGVRDVRSSLKRAGAGGMLNTRELMDIAGVLRSAREALSYASGDEKSGRSVDYLFSSLRANKYLEEKITNSIIGDNELSDAASPELADIRRAMRVAGDKVRQALQKIISSPAYAKVLQEPIITVKNGRYVVPVKAECKSSVPGLTHDISSSGATLFIEPMSAVKANNEIRELLAREEREIDRILMELSAEASDFSDDISTNYRVLTQLDLIFAKAKLSYKLNAVKPAISENGELELKKARHPLLKQDTAVPIDISLGGEFDTLVITGPNTGGKTVSLKTVGLLCLMAECGLHIPAGDGSVVPLFEKILADIGDEQSIEQSLSTFSSHMTNIVGILKECGEGSLVLFDELGAGTDPAEGAALAVAVIEYARSAGAHIAATTHYAELKIYAMTQSGVMNASCEFDVKTLKPTYRLLMGIPGKSNAFAISERLGLPEHIIEDARRRMDAGDADFEEALSRLEENRKESEQRRAETAALLQKAKADAEAAARERREAEEERRKFTKNARREAERILENAREAADEAFKDIERQRREAADNDWQRLNEAKSRIRRSLNEAESRVGPSEPEPKRVQESVRPARAGDVVEILSIGSKANVISVSPDGTLELQAGIMKINAKQCEVRVLEGEKIKVERAATVSAPASSGSMKPELDLRGMTAEEAVSMLERFIDTAQMRHINTVTIIHGKGTGVLRQAVQQCLKRSRQVKSFRLGRFGEGEAGVTIAEIK
ncbi:MAG: endonuclease MutS2 [Oscillospiraceae bacterium]